jgi:hypothetical protein
MKKTVLMAALAMAALPVLSSAASPSQQPNDPPYIALSMPVTTLVVLGYSLTGQGKELCDKLGGKWEPLAEGNNCPGGRWLRFYGVI